MGRNLSVSSILLATSLLTSGCARIHGTPKPAPSPQILPQSVQAASVGGNDSAANATLNPYWPLAVGNSWTFRKADNGHQLTITVQPTPAKFGCATRPIHLYFHKEEADAYWGPSLALNLHWILGIENNGDIRGYGHYVENLQGVLEGDTMNYRSIDPETPAYFLVPGNATQYQSSSTRHSLPTASGITDECIPGNDNFYSTWHVTWTQTTVNTPAYSGPALKAAYDEQSGGRQIEDWYFAPGIGVVRIVVKSQDGSASVDMQLTSYRLRDPAVPSPGGTPAYTTANLAVAKTPNPPSSSPRVIDVSVGDTVYFNWTSQNAKTLKSYYFSDGPDGCGVFGPQDTQRPWLANTLSGNTTGVIQPCQAGHHYTITVQSVSATGELAPSSVTLRVAPVPPELPPVVSLSLSPVAKVGYLKLAVGQTAQFFWSVTNATRVESYFYSTAPDFCPVSFNVPSTQLPWVAIAPGSGSTQQTLLPCQAARSYTFVITAYSRSGRQVGRDQVVVEVEGNVQQKMFVAGATQSQTWDAWVFFFRSFTGQETPPIETFVPVIAPAKRFSPVPLDTWWDCTQLGNCTAMIAHYAPELVMEPPTITSSGSGCDACSCGWVAGRNFYDRSMEVVIWDADWNFQASLTSGLVIPSRETLQFLVPEHLRAIFSSRGLRFSVVNQKLNQWANSELIQCTP